MPRFFFDTVDTGHPLPDDVGVELSDRESARSAAISALIDLARDELPDGDHREFVMTIREEQGTQLLSVRLVLDVAWLDQPARG